MNILKNALRIFAIILLLVLGLGGVIGGWMLISEPSGKNFEWTTEILEGTPFQNFMIPGIVLLIFNGILPIVIAIFSVVKIRKYALLIIIQGCILIGWLSAEIVFNSNLYSPELHPLFYGIAILLMIIGFILVKLKNKKVD